MVEPDAVLEVSDGVLDLGVAPMVGLQFQGVPLPVGDAAVIAVGGEEGQLGTGRGLDPGSVPSSIRVRSQAFFGGLSGLVVTRPVAPTASLCELLR